MQYEVTLNLFSVPILFALIATIWWAVCVCGRESVGDILYTEINVTCITTLEFVKVCSAAILGCSNASRVPRECYNCRR